MSSLSEMCALFTGFLAIKTGYIKYCTVSEDGFYILTLYVLMLYLRINVYNFSGSAHRLTVVQS
jgi:hypothetical protein